MREGPRTRRPIVDSRKRSKARRWRPVAHRRVARLGPRTAFFRRPSSIRGPASLSRSRGRSRAPPCGRCRRSPGVLAARRRIGPASAPSRVPCHGRIPAVFVVNPKRRRGNPVRPIRSKPAVLFASRRELQAAAMVTQQTGCPFLRRGPKQIPSHDCGDLLGLGLLLLLLPAPLLFLDLLVPDALHLVRKPPVGALFLLFLFLSAQEIDLLLNSLLRGEEPILLLLLPVLSLPRRHPGRDLHHALRGVPADGDSLTVRFHLRGMVVLLLLHRRRNRTFRPVDRDRGRVLPPRALLEDQFVGRRPVAHGLVLGGGGHAAVRVRREEQNQNPARCECCALHGLDRPVLRARHPQCRPAFS